MRRPMVFAAVSMGMGTAITFLTELKGLLLFILLTVAILILLKKEHTFKRGLALFLASFLLGAALFQLKELQTDPLQKEEGHQSTITGKIIKAQKKGGGYKLVLRSQGHLRLVNYYGKIEEDEFLEGRFLQASGQVTLPDPRRNPGCFDYRLYLKTLGIRVMVNAGSAKITGGSPNRIAKIKHQFTEKLITQIGERRAGVLLGMLFGDKTFIDEELYETFQKNGTAHILSVSGLHVGILYALLAFLWRGRKGPAFYVFITAFLIFYAALAEFSPSVMRAAIMILLHLGANLLHRRYDLLTAGAFTFMLMLCVNPMQLFHIGFQLSFLAIASLGVFLPTIKHLYSGIFLSGAAIQAGMAPFTAYLFNYVSLGAIVVNIPIIFLAGILVPMGVILMVFCMISETLFSWGAQVIGVGCDLLINLNDFTYANGTFSFDVCSPGFFFLVLYYGGLFFYLSEAGKLLFLRKQWKKLIAAGLMILLLALFARGVSDEGFSAPGLVFVDVGQGDCLHIRTDQGKNYLIDGGGSTDYNVGKKVLKPYLLKNGVKKIDTAFVSHLHADHYQGIEELAREGLIDNIAVYDGNRIKEQELKEQTETNLTFLYKGQEVKLDRDVSLLVLQPEQKSIIEYEQAKNSTEDENSVSLITKVHFKGTTILMTGDIDEAGEQALVTLYGKSDKLQSDILKIAHHGSKYSSSDLFLDAVQPGIAVIQVGRNSYGHPANSVLEKCREKGIMVYRNDQMGAIGFFDFSKNKSFSITTMRKDKQGSVQ